MEQQTIECPTCRSEVPLTVFEQCENCADGEIATWIERLRPKRGE
jgi:hypothetical protein